MPNLKPMSQHPKPCKNGHTAGRKRNGVCKQCHKDRCYRERRARSSAWARANLPLTPLRELIEMRMLEHLGQKGLSRRLAPDLGQSSEVVERTMQRLLKPATNHVSWSLADAWCCALGVPITSIYSDAELNGEWEREKPKPRSAPRCQCGRVILAKGWNKCHVCRNEDSNFRCITCGKGLMSNHGLFLHALQVHGDKSQGRHSWHSKAVV